MGLTSNCDLRPNHTFASLVIEDINRQYNTIPPAANMTEAESLTFADFGFADDEQLEAAQDIMSLDIQEAATEDIKMEEELDEDDVGDENMVLDLGEAANSGSVSEETMTDKSAASPNTNIEEPNEVATPTTLLGYAAFREANPGIKRRGRPVGWRKSLHMKPKVDGPQPPRKKAKKNKKAASDETAPTTPQMKPLEIIQYAPKRPERKAATVGTSSPSTTDDEVEQIMLPSNPYVAKDIENEDMPLSFWQEVLEAAAGIKLDDDGGEDRRDSVLDTNPSILADVSSHANDDKATSAPCAVDTSPAEETASAASAATHRVLATYELIEKILFRLETKRDILGARLVNKAFGHVCWRSREVKQIIRKRGENLD